VSSNSGTRCVRNPPEQLFCLCCVYLHYLHYEDGDDGGHGDEDDGDDDVCRHPGEHGVSDPPRSPAALPKDHRLQSADDLEALHQSL